MVSDNMYIWAGLIAFNYILFLKNNDFFKRIIGDLFMVLLGLGGYLFIGVTMPWGLIISFLGIILLVYDIIKV